MMRDVLPRRKDGEEGGGAAGGGLGDHLHCLRVAAGIFLVIRADPAEEEGLPLVITLDHADLLHDVLEAGHGLAVLHDHVELGADLLPVGLDGGHPREVA